MNDIKTLDDIHIDPGSAEFAGVKELLEAINEQLIGEKVSFILSASLFDKSGNYMDKFYRHVTRND